MARTNAYKAQILKDINRINYRLKGIEQLLGTESEQYERYVNSLTATLPAGSYTLSYETRQIRVSTSKINLQSLKHEQLSTASHLPTAKQSIHQQKKEIARRREAASEGSEPITVSDEEALNELNAKTFIRDRMDAKGKLKYSEGAKASLKQKGNKSYADLARIIKEAEAKDNAKTEERKKKSREASRRYYEKHRAEINQRRREKRQRAKLGLS